MNSFYRSEYGFLFEEERDFVPGIGEMITVLGPGEELAKQREALGLTQQEIANRAKINIRQYQRLESGERSLNSTSFRVGLNVCYALKIDPNYYCAALREEEGKRVQEQSLRNEDNDSYKELPRQQFKYVIHRTDAEGALGEIIGVEYGAGIDAAFDRIAQAIRDDLSADIDCKNCNIDIYPPEQLEEHRYSVQSAVVPYAASAASSNELHEYLITEREQE